MTQDQGLAGLLGRVEAGTIDSQWALIRDVTRELLDVADLLRARINGLCDHGGYESAVLALCTRVLPGWRKSVVDLSPDPCEGYVWQTGWGFNIQGKGATPALAMIAALLRALISQSSESGEGDRASRNQPGCAPKSATSDAEPSGAGEP